MGRGSQPLKTNKNVKSSANNVAIAVIASKISPKPRKRCEDHTLQSTRPARGLARPIAD